MCRNIKKLRFSDRSPSDEELQLAALQFVRKISGYRVPAERNQAVFEEAVREIGRASRQLFDQLSQG